MDKPSGSLLEFTSVSKDNVILQRCKPFLIGGTSGIVATICVQPQDMVKVRMQLTSNTGSVYGHSKFSALTVIKDVLQRGSVFDFYAGLSAAIARQVVYGTARLGLFATFEKELKGKAAREGYDYSFSQRTIASMSAGALAALLGNPTEVALIRMQSDGMLPLGQRQRYRSVFDAFGRIVKQEGLLALWKGWSPTVVRAISTNFGQLAWFSESKHQLRKHTQFSDWQQSLVASAIGGFSAAFFSMPFDTMKSRLQSRQSVYKGMFDCFRQILMNEGPLRFYRGFPAYFSRLGPHS